MIKTEVGKDYFYYVNHLLENDDPREISSDIEDTHGREYLLKSALMPRYPEVYLNAVMDRFRPKSVLEIGTFWGAMTSFFARYPSTRSVFTIDIERFKQTTEIWQFISPKNRGKIAPCIVRSDEDKAACINEFIFDFCFIDGLHTYEGVKFDFECVKDKCDVVLFHDYGTNEGVTDFINEQGNIEWQSIELSFALWVNK
jgi:hypothetical protein